MARKSTDYVQFKLRIRESLRRKIERAAEKQAHSANAEAVERIEHTFAEAERYKDFEALRDEVDKERRRLYAESASRDALFKASYRDTQILNMMVSGDSNRTESAKLLRLIALELARVPDWASTPESKKALTDRIRDLILNTDFPPNEYLPHAQRA